MTKKDPKEYYKEEAAELLDSMENLLVELEEQPEDVEVLDKIFRALHTIKGSGAMFGFDEVARFCHEAENLFDLLRSGQLKADKKIIDLGLAARDHIYALLFADDYDFQRGEELMQLLRELSGNPASVEEASSQPQKTESGEAEEIHSIRTYRICFKPHQDFFLRGARALSLFSELCALGKCRSFAHEGKIPLLEDMNPELCYLYWTILLTTRAELDAIKDVFIFVEDYSEINISLIDDEQRLDLDDDYKQIGEILAEQGVLTQEDIEKIIRHKERFGEIAMDEGILTEDDVESALEEQKYVRSLRKKRKEERERLSIRVQSDKLDSLVDLVGELVTLQARLSQFSSEQSSREKLALNELQNISENLERLTTELRDNTMSLRMVPIGELFASFNRLVRDLSSELDKSVRLEISGAETEIDKNVIDALKDPLVHILRNALDHGLEGRRERADKGKPEEGCIHISAEYSGSNVMVKIEDDGRGIDLKQIKEKAIQKRLMAPDKELSEKETMMLLFLPGFSTTEKATAVSGRGVGMDVVKKSIEGLRGSINISSEKGKGTKISLSIPLTLSITDGLLVAVGKEHYIINISEVDECFDAKEDFFQHSRRNDYLMLRREIIPFIDLRELFKVKGETEKIRQVVVVKVDGSKTALIVDKIIGQHQTVIKALGPYFREIEEISGSTILGDGRIAFILDLNKLYQKVSSR